MIKYAAFVEGLSELDVSDISPAIQEAAKRAINATANRVRKDSADLILSKLNFPATYLNPSTKRLAVTAYASRGSLEAIITGRHRATSLARFVTGGTAGKKGARVSINRGSSVDLPNAFLMKLRTGTGIETANNLGLAIRTKRGAEPEKAYKPVQISESLWLLYGPSVDQAFRFAAEKEAPAAAAFLAAEFSRIMALELEK